MRSALRTVNAALGEVFCVRREMNIAEGVLAALGRAEESGRLFHSSDCQEGEASQCIEQTIRSIDQSGKSAVIDVHICGPKHDLGGRACTAVLFTA